MKKLTLLLITIFLVCVPTKGQSKDYQQLTINSVSLGEYMTVYNGEEFVEKLEWTREEKTTLAAVIDYKNDVVKISNTLGTFYKLKKVIKVESLEDFEGDATLVTTFECIDYEGDKCTVVIRVWEEYKNIQILAMYDTFSILWEGVTLNFN